MVTEFLQDIDCLQRLRVLSSQKSPDFRRSDEESIQIELERREGAEYHMLIFDRHCLMLTGSRENECGLQYFESRSFVRRMMNLVTNEPNSFSFFSHSSLTASLAAESRPRMITFSKFFRKSFLDPKKSGLAKLSNEKYSERSFCLRVTGKARRVHWTHLNGSSCQNDTSPNI